MVMEIISLIVSLIVGFVSVFLACFAIWLSKSAANESRKNFERTQELMQEYDIKNREVLSEIDKRAALIQQTVAESHQQLLGTMTSLLKETFLPTKADPDEELKRTLLPVLVQDPEKLRALMDFAQEMERKSQQ